MTAAPTEIWIRDQLASRVDDLVRCIGIDFLLGESYTAPWDVDSALTALVDGIAAVGRDSSEYMVALVVPLAPVDELAASPPDPAALDLHEVEPPSLYLFDRRFFATRFNEFEEYRTPVLTASPTVARGQVRAYYSCFRDSQARSNNWEYSRALWFQHFDVE